MKADDIRRQNEKYYYSSYVWPVWMHHRGVIFGICVMMTVVSMCVKQTFLKHKYILEASRQELGQTDVMRWVNAQVSAHRFDYMFIFILAANLIAWGFVVFFMFRYKSYEQYKKKLNLARDEKGRLKKGATIARKRICDEVDLWSLYSGGCTVKEIIEPVLLTEDMDNPLYCDIRKTGILIQ